MQTSSYLLVDFLIKTAIQYPVLSPLFSVTWSWERFDSVSLAGREWSSEIPGGVFFTGGLPNNPWRGIRMMYIYLTKWVDL